ncbi:hypothetical protein [Streptomyces griseus]|uniref:hypothetical protein n=1 Tax=Streptomyces griseus TaxID=1911 RepID=UPI000B29CC15|nr:hypothetical protein [Streptomyces griseus]
MTRSAPSALEPYEDGFEAELEFTPVDGSAGGSSTVQWRATTAIGREETKERQEKEEKEEKGELAVERDAGRTFGLSPTGTPTVFETTHLSPGTPPAGGPYVLPVEAYGPSSWRAGKILR